MDTAKKWASEILDCAPLSVRAIKQAATLGMDMGLEEAYNTRFPAQEAMQGSEDQREGPRAFAEKRKPVWTGR
jgi:crotonobetainyl-CoA hydratase/dehydration protein DpgD